MKWNEAIQQLYGLVEPIDDSMGQEAYDPDSPHTYKHAELRYIEIMAKKGRAHAAKVKDDQNYDMFQHILDNVKILVDRLG